MEQVCQYSHGYKFKINSKESKAKTAILPKYKFWLSQKELMSAFINNFIDQYSKPKNSYQVLKREENNLMLKTILQKFFVIESK